VSLRCLRLTLSFVFALPSAYSVVCLCVAYVLTLKPSSFSIARHRIPSKPLVRVRDAFATGLGRVRKHRHTRHWVSGLKHELEHAASA
jgi:hypothetical protein